MDGERSGYDPNEATDKFIKQVEENQEIIGNSEGVSMHRFERGDENYENAKGTTIESNDNENSSTINLNNEEGITRKSFLKKMGTGLLGLASIGAVGVMGKGDMEDERREGKNSVSVEGELEKERDNTATDNLYKLDMTEEEISKAKEEAGLRELIENPGTADGDIEDYILKEYGPGSDFDHHRKAINKQREVLKLNEDEVGQEKDGETPGLKQ